MALTDAQIDRFSRQIVLPEIGGRGQERLLHASVALAGDGELARTAALYLTGSGIGRVALHGAAGALRDELIALNPDTQVERPPGDLGTAAADVLVACNVALGELDSAAARRRTLVAAGYGENGGWLVVSHAGSACPSCAARVAGHSSGLERRALAPTAGVLGSLVSLEIVKLLLGIGDQLRPVWWQFDPSRSLLTERSPAPTSDCPVCRAG